MSTLPIGNSIDEPDDRVDQGAFDVRRGRRQPVGPVLARKQETTDLRARCVSVDAAQQLEAVTEGFRSAFVVALAFPLLGFVAAMLLLGRRKAAD
jgi:hypothetical protein